ncbi:MAG: transposase [Nitrosopumilaceae archaeon]|nr:transposase [Nitrosopumilaceae archaeon]
MKLNTKRVRWIIRHKRMGETNASIAQATGVSPRWVKKIWSRYRYADIRAISYQSRAGRHVSSMHGRRKHSAVLSARTNEHLGASILRARIKKRSGLNIPKAVIHRGIVENGMAREDPRKKKKRRRWVRYERTYSNSMWHTDWKQIHGGMHDGRWFLCYEDDASRFVTGYGIFDNATAENALRVLDEAIRDHGRPASIMTDHGAQFYANEKESRERGKSGFEKRLVELGIRQILAGVGHPQTNGKIERLHGEIQRKLHEFESIMMRKSDPIDLFMRWYNYDRPHMSLEDGETPAEAFERKMAPKGERIIDEQTGEEYDVR